MKQNKMTVLVFSVDEEASHRGTTDSQKWPGVTEVWSLSHQIFIECLLCARLVWAFVNAMVIPALSIRPSIEKI